MEFWRFLRYHAKSEERKKNREIEKIGDFKFLVSAIHTDDPNKIIEQLNLIEEGKDPQEADEVMDFNKFTQFKGKVESYRAKGGL